MIRIIILLISFGTAALTTSAQNERLITGVVREAEQATPLEGVTVGIKGTNKVSGSQPDGVFYIKVSATDSVLVFSIDEFETTEIPITQASEYQVTLSKGRSIIPVAPSSPLDNLAGSWRGEFFLDSTLTVPFNFEITTGSKSGASIIFINGEERFEGGRIVEAGDSIQVYLDQFDNILSLRFADNELTGVLRKQEGTSRPLKVSASRAGYRFKESGQQPTAEFTGTYEISFPLKDGSTEKGSWPVQAEWEKLTATFLRVTGDSRYLDGQVEGNEFRLSSFIGSNPGFYKGKLNADGTINGEIVFAGGRQPFSGLRNEDATLPDPYKLTYLKNGYTGLDFSFPDINGRKISLKDKKYKNKVVILTITGTWCPNCVDEAAFLSPWYKKNKSRGVEAIAIHYERKTDTAYTRKVITRFRNKFDIQYDQVIAGPADKQFVASSLPALNSFLSFPTTIIIDKKGNVAEIHTGYTGPATGKYYDEFVSHFNAKIGELLK